MADNKLLTDEQTEKVTGGTVQNVPTCDSNGIFNNKLESGGAVYNDGSASFTGDEAGIGGGKKEGFPFIKP